MTVKEVDGFLSVNKFLMEVIMADEYFAYHRNFTQLNDLESVISAIQFGEKINQWLAQQLEEDEDLREQSLKIRLPPWTNAQAAISRSRIEKAKWME